MLKRLALLAVLLLAMSLVAAGAGNAETQAPNPNCTLTVPPRPLTAEGLATPYQLAATTAADGACHETDPAQSAFVEAAIYDPATHAISLYRPLVIDQGTEPGAPPVPVTLPPGAVVATWFGFQGTDLTLAGATAGCVNGLPGSVFGQFAYCNAPALFLAARFGHVQVPPLGTGNDGLPCPTTRSFAVVDQDQSDNVDTRYKLVDGKIAQATAPGQTDGTIRNASDNGLLNRNILPALGCQSFTAPDLTLADHSPSPALALNELSATQQGAPAALVPQNDPMVLVNDRFAPIKTGLYRIGVNQPFVGGQSPAQYCTDLMRIAPARLVTDQAQFAGAPSPDAAFPSLLAFLQDRYTASLANLKCQTLVDAGPGPKDHPHGKHGDRYDR